MSQTPGNKVQLPAGAICIVLVCLAAYIPAIRNGFVWDDYDMLTGNIVLKENGLYHSWFSAGQNNYWPVTWTSYWLEHKLWKLNPTGYHITNILIHTACTLLIWCILIQLNIPAAFTAALIFAVHPVNVESVAWIAQRKTILAMLFFLPALFYYLRFDQTGRKIFYVLSVILFIPAMLSKGSVVGLPVVILLCVWWLRGTISRRDIIRSMPFFAVSAVMSVVEIWFQYNRAISEDVVRSDSFLSRLAGAGWAVWFYLYKAILPINLTFIYPRWHIDAANRVSYVPGLLLVVLLMLTWRYRRGWGRPAFFAFVYFVVMLFPVLGFFNIYFMRYSFVADHYQYVSIISVIALATGMVYRYLGAGVLRIAAVFVLMLLGAATWQQSSRYKNAITLWEDTLRKAPNCAMAHNNLGNLLQFQGKIEAAVSHFYQAINKDPNFFEAYNNLGNALLLQGKADEAVFYYSRSLELNPANARIHYNLATVLQSQGRSEEAAKHYIEALRFKPDFVNARSNLAVCLAGVGKFDDAIVNFTEALRMKPNSAELHHNLAIALDSQGRSAEALVHYNRALELASAENNQQLIDQIHKKLEFYSQPEPEQN